MATRLRTLDSSRPEPATRRPAAGNVDAYISDFPPDVQTLMQTVRATIREAVPGVEETISYESPAFRLMGRPLIYFAGFKHHVGVYPAPLDHEAFRDDLAPYRSGRATMRLPLDAPPPLDLLRRIVAFRVQRILETAEPSGR
jgi:uncharacterized protein YdhG (YjbR/CyaY superfamily)